MKKVTDLGEKEVIHVRTEAEDLAIRTLMHDAGLSWFLGGSYIELDFAYLYPKGYLPKNGTWAYIDQLSDGYTIHPASDFIAPSIEDLTEQLKKAAEAKGLSAEVVFKEKDIWECVEFVELLNDWNGFEKGSVARVIDKEDVGLIVFSPIGKSTSSYSPNAWFQKDLKIIKPSTESAYVEQLKAEAKKRFGEIKEGDRFKECTGIESVYNEIFHRGNKYYKDSDSLYFEHVLIYQSGKWAERVKERVEVVPIESELSNGVDFVFKAKISTPTRLRMGTMIHLVKHLEEYLNKE